jgi:hypothetical protein
MPLIRHSFQATRREHVLRPFTARPFILRTQCAAFKVTELLAAPGGIAGLTSGKDPADRMYYRLCDLVLRSEIPLPELCPATGTDADLTIRLSPQPWPGEPQGVWLRERCHPDGRPYIASARLATGYLLRFHGLGDFTVGSGGQVVTCYPLAGLPVGTLRYLLVDQVLPLVLGQRGRLVLHASCVALRRGAVAFLGQAGAGKSTLAASFAGQGNALLTDDCLLVVERGGKQLAVPSYPAVRLWPDAAVDLVGPDHPGTPVASSSLKQRFGPENSGMTFGDAPQPLRRLYVLTGDAPITVTPLTAAEAFPSVVRSCMQLDACDPAWLRAVFPLQVRLAHSGLVRRLTCPRDLTRLPAVRAAIQLDVSTPQGPDG